MLAPMAMSLKQRGVPVRIVYLGHRDGTAMMVAADSDVQDMYDLRGERILVPSRYSNQYLWLSRLLEKAGMTFDDVELRECPPPDMPAMLETGSCAAYIVGEPFAARTEYAGTGRVLYLTKDEWPNFISCVVVVREELIAGDRALVQELVDGIAGSGLWLDQAPEHRVQAAQVAGKHYYRQDPRLLEFVLTKPPDRVKYTNLAPHRGDFDEIMELAVRVGVLREPIAFEDYADPSFSDDFDGTVLVMPPPGASDPGDTGGREPVSPRLERVLLPGLVFAAILAFWLAFVGGPGVADFPTPGRVWQAFRQLVEWPDEVRVPRLLGYAIASVFRVTWGFFLAVAVAVPLGLVLGWRTRLYRAFNPLIQVLRPISPIAWIPIAILLVANDDQRAIFLIFLSTFFPIVVSTTAAVRNIPRGLHPLGRRTSAAAGCAWSSR